MKKNEVEKHKLYWMELPGTIQLMIYSFLNPAPMHRMSLTCHNLSEQIEKIYQQWFENVFSRSFGTKDLKEYKGQDLKTLWGVLYLYHQFTAEIHLQKTPYYSRLMRKTIQAFIARKKLPIKTFPWANLIINNLMLIWDGRKTVEYVEPVARLEQLSITTRFNETEKKELKKTNLSIATNRKDFVISFFDSNQNKALIHFLEQLPQDHRLFEFLRDNYEYHYILEYCFDSFFDQKIITKTKKQLIEEWLTQMRESKDPIMTVYTAAGLFRVFNSTSLQFSLDLPTEQMQAYSDECLSKGGCDMFPRFHYTQKEYIQILESIILNETPVRPEFLGACFKELGFLTEANAEKTLEQNHAFEMIWLASNYYWQAICHGFPQAVFFFNQILSCKGFSKALTACSSSSVALDEGKKLFFYKIIYSAQQSISWLVNLEHNSHYYILENQNQSKTVLMNYSESKNADVQAATHAALGLVAIEEEDYKTAEVHFNKARNNMPVFQEYINFIKEAGYLLLSEDLRFVQKILNPDVPSSVTEYKQNFLENLTTPQTTPVLNGSAPEPTII